ATSGRYSPGPTLAEVREAGFFMPPVYLNLPAGASLSVVVLQCRFFLYFALQAMRRGNLLVYAPTVPVEVQGRLPFVTFVGGLEEAIARARDRFPKHADVLIVPRGGSTFPILPA
ncbi:MAG: hypothetical protein M1482_04825, partial [Chloroflexi bacterium]|nr:hypothetical protein [Chloroflexota bacterium]